MQRGFRMITLQRTIEKSPILLSQYWKFRILVGVLIFSPTVYFTSSDVKVFRVESAISGNSNLQIESFNTNI